MTMKDFESIAELQKGKVVQHKTLPYQCVIGVVINNDTAIGTQAHVITNPAEWWVLDEEFKCPMVKPGDEDSDDKP